MARKKKAKNECNRTGGSKRNRTRIGERKCGKRKEGGTKNKTGKIILRGKKQGK